MAKDARSNKQRIAELEAEVNQLRRWKAEAIVVLDQWDEVNRALGSPAAWGESVPLACARRARELMP